jgi:hypothetical protein
MNPIIGLSLGRIVVGILFYFRPDLVAKAMGQDLQRQPELAFGSRLFGVRDVALGATTLLAKGTARRNLLVAGVVVDAADAAASALTAKEKGLKPAPAAAFAGVAMFAVVQGLMGLRQK